MNSSKTIKNESIRKRKVFILTASFITLIALILISWKLFLTAGTACNKNSNEKNMNNETAFSFIKKGELTFLSADGKKISAIEIETAENEDEWAMGLMYRTTMAENQGMLFIFPNEDFHTFWMQNTVLPLDIIFVNAKKEIIKIHKNTVPFQESPSYDSDKPAMYAVEVNAGYCDKFKIKEGDKISYTKL